MTEKNKSLQNPLVVEKYRKIVQVAASIGLVLTALIALWVAKGSYFKPTLPGGASLFETHLRQSGLLGPLIFMLVQIIQVVLPVIPGGLVSVSGTAVFGYIWGFAYNFIGITIGSIVAFFLARRYGEFFVKCFVSDETYEKYFGWTRNEKRFAWILGTIFFLPAAPDDIMCMVAGLSPLSFRKFILIFIPTKAVSTFVFTWMMQEMIVWFIANVWPYIIHVMSPVFEIHWMVSLSGLAICILVLWLMFRKGRGKEVDKKEN